jgi:hypothetical protein
MIQVEQSFLNCINSPLRRVKGRVELYKGSALIEVYKGTDALQSFTIDRVADAYKPFGYGICQKATVKLLDRERKINISKENSLEAVFGTGCDYAYTNPLFYVDEIKRDENTNALTITAFDALHKAAKHTVAELSIITPYTIERFIKACGTFLGLPVVIEGVEDKSFETFYDAGANFDGTETIRAALDAAAEATQTIYFINHNWELVFKRLDVNGSAVFDITKDKYFTLENKTDFVITGICSATELGDNVAAGSGSMVYIRNNPFWEMRDDIAALVERALAAVNGLTLTQFSCSWRGNYLLEIGDKISLTTKDNQVITGYVLNDSITYNGALNEKTSWSFDNTAEQTASNPTTIGDAIKQTYARVDKVNKEIELKVNANNDKIANLILNENNIAASVTQLTQETKDAFANVNDDITTLTNKVSATMTAEDIKFEIENVKNGINTITTTTGYTFNDEGLTVTKSGSEMATQITEDGMKVYRDNTAVLTANNIGVDAVNLHATTYLIIGTKSRLEDYGSNRTGCFWIGG